ncbi:MAG: hypothetical protein NC293_00665 [Roseburia sp.]|nr:hypothetical protein [Roseburia sp.]
MSDMRKLIRDIDRGMHLDKNLPVYAKMLAGTYLNYAAVELTLSAYILSECASEYERISANEKEMYDDVMQILRKMLSDEAAKPEEIMTEAERLRDGITQVMETFTSYTDRLLCYDYVLRRMELKYSKDKKLLDWVKKIDENEFLSMLMIFLVSAKDKTVMRDRLQTLIGQMPVHMTKNKFLERVEESIGLYKGGDVLALDGFVYMLRSVAMLNHPDDSLMFDDEIREFADSLEQAEFTELTEEKYREFTEKMEIVTENLHEITDFYYSMQKVVNGIYALCLAKKHGGEPEPVFEVCMDILKEVTEDTFIEEHLERLEGKIETYVETSSYLEAVLFEVRMSCRDTLEELGISREFEDYAAIAGLLSDSLFIDINAKKESGTVDEKKVREVSAQLTEELSELLGSLKRPVKTAVMAAILEQLPADFSNEKEIEEYIRINLFGCQNFSEKGFVLLELKEMMKEAAEWSEV